MNKKFRAKLTQIGRKGKFIMYKKFLPTFPVLLICRRLCLNVMISATICLGLSEICKGMGDETWERVDEYERNIFRPQFYIVKAKEHTCNREKKHREKKLKQDKGGYDGILAQMRASCVGCKAITKVELKLNKYIAGMKTPSYVEALNSPEKIEIIAKLEERKIMAIDWLHLWRRGKGRSDCIDYDCYLCKDAKQVQTKLLLIRDDESEKRRRLAPIQIQTI